MGTYYGTSGNDSFTTGSDNDVVYLGDGNDSAITWYGDDTIYGGNGNDALVAMQGTDLLYGEAGNDTLWGYDGNDTLVGGTDNDLLYGEKGSDTYIFNLGDGNDTICETYDRTNSPADGTDIILFGAGITQENLIFTKSGNDLVINFNNSTGSITIKNQFLYSTDKIEYFVFSDGTKVVSSVVEALVTDSTIILGTDDDDLLVGSEANEIVLGYAGNDTLNGGAGADTMYGGAGDDIYYVDNTADVVSENDNEGIDTVHSYVDYTLGDNVENLTLRGSSYYLNGTGNSLDNIILGTGFNNKLIGLGGNDTLDGGITGCDTLIGGTGDDVYYVNAGDIVIENVDEGTDTVNSSITYTLGDNVENLILTGSSDINGQGNALNNSITGNSGNNSLNGGSGADTMYGGAGDDIYYVDNAADVVSENENEGLDTVHSYVDYTLGDNVENLTLRGSSYYLNGTGNSLDNLILGTGFNNKLVGLAGNDTLDGGVTGSDTLIGGTGDDVYYVNAGDIVTENVDEGTDTVNSSITYTLGDNVENLILTGSSDINGQGNALNNSITGNSGNNSLNGGSGADTMYGGAGDDIYQFSSGDGLDIVVDSSGTDEIVMDSTVSKSNIAIYLDSEGNLIIDYGTISGFDQITISSQSTNTIEEIVLSDGEYITSTQINQLIQDMTAYATANSIDLTSVTDVKSNSELMTIVANAFQAA